MRIEGHTPNIINTQKPTGLMGELGKAAMAATVYGLSSMLGGNRDEQVNALHESNRSIGESLAAKVLAA